MSLKFAFREIVLAAGARKRIHEIASFFMLVSNTGSEKIRISIDDSPMSDMPIGYEYSEKKEDEFYTHVDFQNPNAAEVTVEYIMSTGVIRTFPTIIALLQLLAEMTGLSSGEVWDEEKTIGVAASVVMALNASRHSGAVQAKSTNTGIIYIGYNNTVTTTKWIAELQPGQSYSFDDWLGTIYAISDTAAQLLGYGEH
ncbi:hypothetical protein LCGC14_1655810 [marine sediment metagenome]|uniref:Uncharacterized protein n=1 Tax=marine sediment metagenome TaxID=412755 RepID=A0A0F9HW38_9ZZZZ